MASHIRVQRARARDEGIRDDLPRSSRSRDEGDFDDLPRRPKKKQGMSVGMILLIIFGSLAAVGCVICTGVAVVVGYGVVKAKEAVDDIQQQVAAGRIPEGKGKVVLNTQARLQPNDPQREFKPDKPFTVKLDQGKTYVISLSSGEMDSYLFLYDPQGRMVAQDDDSGGMLNSRIHFTPNQAGNYTVSCTVLNQVPPGGAAFNVSVRERD